jgi:hypothetical protein
MKKRLNTEGITNELENASAFFTRRPSPPAKPDTSPLQQNTPQTNPTASTPERSTDNRHERPATIVRTEQPIDKQTSTTASTLASYPDSVIEAIRKAVKHTGREVTFVRLTPEEKGQLADIVYTYKRQGVKTSENEISRIAISYLLADYKANGQESILAKVIASLLA